MRDTITRQLSAPPLRTALQEHAGEVGIVELEVSLVVKLEEGGRVRMVLLEVKIVELGLGGGVAAVLTHVHLGSPLLVVVLVSHAVHLETVRLQGTALGEGLFAEVALVGPHTSVSAGVALQVERVVESLAAEGAEVALDVAVALHVSV